jgi:hypothetical protein
MKVTLEIPDQIVRRARTAAAQRGVALRAFVVEAVEEKLASASRDGKKPWVRLAGGLKRHETVRINGIMKSEFESIRP